MIRNVGSCIRGGKGLRGLKTSSMSMSMGEEEIAVAKE